MSVSFSRQRGCGAYLGHGRATSSDEARRPLQVAASYGKILVRRYLHVALQGYALVGSCRDALGL